MTQMTKVEKLLFKETQNAKVWNEFSKTYHFTLIRLIFNYKSASYEDFAVNNGIAGVRFQSHKHGFVDVILPIVLPEKIDYDIFNGMSDIVYCWEEYQKSVQEEKRKEQIRVDALAKLTDEEKLVLGIR